MMMLKKKVERGVAPPIFEVLKKPSTVRKKKVKAVIE